MGPFQVFEVDDQNAVDDHDHIYFSAGSHCGGEIQVRIGIPLGGKCRDHRDPGDFPGRIRNRNWLSALSPS